MKWDNTAHSEDDGATEIPFDNSAQLDPSIGGGDATEIPYDNSVPLDPDLIPG